MKILFEDFLSVISNKVLNNATQQEKNKFLGKSFYLSRSKFSDANKKR